MWTSQEELPSGFQTFAAKNHRMWNSGLEFPKIVWSLIFYLVRFLGNHRTGINELSQNVDLTSSFYNSSPGNIANTDTNYFHNKLIMWVKSRFIKSQNAMNKSGSDHVLNVHANTFALHSECSGFCKLNEFMLGWSHPKVFFLHDYSISFWCTLLGNIGTDKTERLYDITIRWINNSYNY